MIHELLVVAVVLGGLACGLLAVLRHLELLSARGALLMEAHVVLGGVLFLGFLLARHRYFPQVLAILAVAVPVNLVSMLAGAHWFPPRGEVPAFLVVMVLLLLSFVIAFRWCSRQLYHFYW
jgi:hypothetical protein